MEQRRHALKPQMRSMLRDMTQWGVETVQRFADEMKRRRQERGLSAQALADRTKQLGHEVSRSTVSDLETGRRGERLMLVDALVIAAALDMPLASLLYPDQLHGLVEFLPESHGTSVSAAAWMGTGDDVVNLDGESVWPDDLYAFNVDFHRGFALEEALLDVEGEAAQLTGSIYKLSDAGREIVLRRYAEHNKKAAKILGLLRDSGVIVSDQYLEARHFDEGLANG